MFNNLIARLRTGSNQQTTGTNVATPNTTTLAQPNTKFYLEHNTLYIYNATHGFFIRIYTCNHYANMAIETNPIEAKLSMGKNLLSENTRELQYHEAKQLFNNHMVLIENVFNTATGKIF